MNQSVCAAKLRRLVAHISSVDIQFGVPETALAPVWNLYSINAPPDLRQFMAAVTPDKWVDAGVVQLFPPQELLTYQVDCSPIYFHTKFELFGIASWSGESDGDCWTYDLARRIIFNIENGTRFDSAEAAVNATTLVFQSLLEWTDFLYSRAEEDGYDVPDQHVR